MLFSQIPGLEETKQTLIGSVKSNHIAHAQLFIGSEGSANLALAMAYATYVNCENKGENDACGECASCTKVNKLVHPDLHFIMPVANVKKKSKSSDDDDATSKTLSKDLLPEWREFILKNPYSSLQDWGNFIEAENKQLNISVEESRSAIKTLSLKSFEGEYKIMIIWLAEFMNSQAANALLKVLEEPPQKTLFLLVTNNLDRIITTILSRTQKIKIRSFSDAEIRTHLQDKLNVDEKKSQQLAYLADGNLNAALHLMQEAEEEYGVVFQEWMRQCYGAKIQTLIEKSDEFSKIGREAQKNMIHYGLNIFREALVFKLAGKELLRLQENDFKFIEGFSKSLSEDKMEKISGLLNTAYYHIERNANSRILFLDLSLQISGVMRAN